MSELNPGDKIVVLLDRAFDRIKAIEARQRAQGVHDPDCAAMKLKRGEADLTGLNWKEVAQRYACDCWLSQEAT